MKGSLIDKASVKDKYINPFVVHEISLIVILISCARTSIKVIVCLLIIREKIPLRRGSEEMLGNYVPESSDRQMLREASPCLEGYLHYCHVT